MSILDDPHTYIDAAAHVGFEIHEAPHDLGWFALTVRTDLPGNRQVWLVRSGSDWRIQEMEPTGWPSHRYWQYVGAGMDTFLRALQHASLYGDGEPDGWSRSWDGRRGDLPPA